MKRLLTLLLLAVSFAACAQVYDDYPGYLGYSGLRALDELEIPNDTTVAQAANTDQCRKLAKKNDVLYHYSCPQGKWVPVAPANALDSAHRSNDTLYFRTYSGAEFAVKMDYYDKGQADDRYKPIGYIPAWNEITDKPATFPPSAHQHPISDVTGLQTALDGKEPAITAGTTAQYWRGDKTWQDFTSAARGAFSAGSNIGLSGGVISNLAPDQPVSLSGGTGISVTGSYPNFTVTNIAPGGSTPTWQQVLTAGRHVTLSPSIGVTEPGGWAITASNDGAPLGNGAYFSSASGIGLRVDINSQTKFLINSGGRALFNGVSDDGTSALQVGGNGVFKNAGGTAGLELGREVGLNALISGDNGFAAWQPLALLSGGLLVSNRSGARPSNDGTSALQVNGDGRFIGNVTSGNAGNTSSYQHQVIRREGATDYTASLGVYGEGGSGWADLKASNGTQDQSIYLPPTGGDPIFRRSDNATYLMWHNGNHMPGEPRDVTFTGAQVPARIASNSSGHLTTVTTRNLTAADIGVNTGAYYGDGSHSLNASALLVTVNGSAHDQIVLFLPSASGNAGRVIHIYNFSGMRYEIDGIGPISALAGVLVCDGSFWTFIPF